MNKMIATMIGFILLALHLSSQVAAMNTTSAPMMNTTMYGNYTTMNGTDSVNGTRGPTGASVSVHANTLTVIVSLALAASSLLQSRA